MDKPSLTTVAVTGTNGKTTTTSMVASIVDATGEPSARVTTVGMWVAGELVATEAEMKSFEETVARAREVGVRTLALEVTSRALADGFARRFPADIGVFTNLSHDHLDRHGSAEAYLAAKAQLFVHLRGPRVAVLNAADPASALLAEVLPTGSRVLRFCAVPQTSRHEPDMDLAVRGVTSTATSLTLELEPSPIAMALGNRLEVSVGGLFNVDNALAAALAAHAAGFAGDAIRQGLASFRGVPGRFHVLSETPLVIVDFAHSPDALLRLLQSARTLAQARSGQLCCVFGCGGERDAEKRPLMGAIADRLSDVVVVTTDNPRSEDPKLIAEAICSGMAGKARCRQIADRATAIDEAVGTARDEDVVVVAGRGHEIFQQLGGRTIPLSDAEIAREVLTQKLASR